MRIVQSPYQARIVPQSPGAPNLWRCVIEQEDSKEVVVLHETARKEDARCMALLELARLGTHRHHVATVAWRRVTGF